MILSISSIRAKSGDDVVKILQKSRLFLKKDNIDRVNVFTKCSPPEYKLLHNPPQFEKEKHDDVEKAVSWIEKNKLRSDHVSKLMEIICINVELLTSSVKAVVDNHTHLLPEQIALLAKNLGCVGQEKAKINPPINLFMVYRLTVVNDNIPLLKIDPELEKLLEELISVVCNEKPTIKPSTLKIPETKTKPDFLVKKKRVKPIDPIVFTIINLKMQTDIVKRNMSSLTAEDIKYFTELLNCQLQLPEAKNQLKSEVLIDALDFIKKVFELWKKEEDLKVVKSLCSK